MHVKRLSGKLFPFSIRTDQNFFPDFFKLENDRTFSVLSQPGKWSNFFRNLSRLRRKSVLVKKSCLKTSSLNLCSVSDAQQPEIGLYMTNENYSRKAAGFAWASRKLQDVIKSSFNLTQAPSTSVWRCTSHNWRERSSTVSDPCEAVVVNGTSSKASSKSHNTLVTPWRSKKACVR